MCTLSRASPAAPRMRLGGFPWSAKLSFLRPGLEEEVRINIDEMRAWLILNEASEGSGGISGRRGTWMCEPVRVPIAS